MAALTTAQEYQAIREAIQLLTTLDANGKRRDRVSVSVDGLSYSYAANQLPMLQEREEKLAARLCSRQGRKRTTPDFSY
jgi:hypothetical protein